MGKSLVLLATSYNDKTFFDEDGIDDYWTYTLSPYADNFEELGNDDFMEYPDQNIWDISMIDI